MACLSAYPGEKRGKARINGIIGEMYEMILFLLAYIYIKW